MAEVLGFVASFAALIQLVQYGAKFAEALYQFSEQSGSPTEEIERFALQASTFSFVISTAHCSLDQHCKNYPDSPVLRFISTNGVLYSISYQSDSIKSRLRKAIRRVKNRLGSKNVVFNFLKWWYQKDSIKDLFPEMECIKTSLQLLLATAQFEIAKLEHNDQASKLSLADMKDLEKSILSFSLYIDIFNHHYGVATGYVLSVVIIGSSK
ncbi:hypothetical protein CORC01_06382 [Colletotrichum orchidophilum]|uniref:Fungal N-terminal domain-containing protein n=1 Tax=Colletotrichum orchidophilum TaxID=1209926 RepID=A0A1G4BAP8_9PEZI|nr:uncharacterized protein CORC01_06382 [Colletotrichum orchidophilum]OHE98386.1 hypothetical protein CORC01_06382 [Colletotrichum orchidophilum]